MLILASYSASNISAAMPEALIMPAPTMLTLQTFVSTLRWSKPMDSCSSERASAAASASCSGTVKLMSFVPCLP